MFVHRVGEFYVFKLEGGIHVDCLSYLHVSMHGELVLGIVYYFIIIIM